MNPTTPPATDLDAMHRLVAERLEPSVIPVKPGHIVVCSNDQQVVDLDEIAAKHRAQPARPKGTVTLDTLASLIDHAKAYQTGDTAAYCTLGTSPRLTVIYDDHPARDSDTAGGGWREHRALYPFPLSVAWLRWTRAATAALSVALLAELLEDRIGDLRDPAALPADAVPALEGVTYATPSQVLTLADGLSVRVDQQVTDVRRRDDGSVRMVFAESVSAQTGSGEEIRIPRAFLLSIPVFVGGSPALVPVRIRYKVANKTVVWSLVLHGAEEILAAAVTRDAARFATETDVPLFYGTP